MKNFLFLLIAIIILGAVTQPFLPWWSIAVVAGVLAIFFSGRPALQFFAGFLGVALLWGAYAFFLDGKNGSLLSNQMGQVFNGLSGMGMIIVTALIGGFVGGFSAMTGSLGRRMFTQNE